VLCCAVLCCAVVCTALFCAVPCGAVLCCVVLRSTAPPRPRQAEHFCGQQPNVHFRSRVVCTMSPKARHCNAWHLPPSKRPGLMCPGIREGMACSAQWQQQVSLAMMTGSCINWTPVYMCIVHIFPGLSLTAKQLFQSMTLGTPTAGSLNPSKHQQTAKQ